MSVFWDLNDNIYDFDKYIVLTTPNFTVIHTCICYLKDRNNIIYAKQST